MQNFYFATHTIGFILDNPFLLKGLLDHSLRQVLTCVFNCLLDKWLKIKQLNFEKKWYFKKEECKK